VDSGSGPSSEIAVHDYSWGAMSGGGVARGSVQNVQLTLDPSSVEPGLWGKMLENRKFQAVVHVRDGSGHEYLTYTFSTATLLSFQTTESDGTAPVDRITLSFDHVAEDYKVLNPDGSVASNNHALLDVSQSTVGAGGNLSAPALAAPPMVGITFDTGSGPSSEIAVHDYSWGAMSGGGVARGSVQNVQLTLDPSSIEPGL